MKKREPFFAQKEHFSRQEEPKEPKEKVPTENTEQNSEPESPDGSIPWEQQSR
jgi:hypothetical protein